MSDLFDSLGCLVSLQHHVSLCCCWYLPRWALWEPNSRHLGIFCLSFRPSRQLLCNNSSTSVCDLWLNLGTGSKPLLIPLYCDSHKLLQKAPGPCFGNSSRRRCLGGPRVWPLNTAAVHQIGHVDDVSGSRGFTESDAIKRFHLCAYNHENKEKSSFNEIRF